MSQTTSEQVISNPYILHATPTIELQLLLFGAVITFVIGFLLAEQTTLRRTLAFIDRTAQGRLLGRPSESM